MMDENNKTNHSLLIDIINQFKERPYDEQCKELSEKLLTKSVKFLLFGMTMLAGLSTE